MAQTKKIAGLGQVDELWGATFKESGFQYFEVGSSEEALQAEPDFLLIDGRRASSRADINKVRSHSSGLILTLVDDSLTRNELAQLKQDGGSGYVSSKTPPEEVVLRIQAMLRQQEQQKNGESRSSHRVWFQELVEFKIFDKTHKAWSTTLSETGIFLRTPLSFPLYSVLHLKFNLWGDPLPFECDSVIVRQEVESDLKGLGVMFQNLKGESIRRLESFFEVYS